ncbi:nuclear transport factor 2 family protein [Pseudonocardia nematodicida]|uniref:Nuclear transport factor 2 family protein n=1 Tax=Pseudonocardia nematodicida TaxID=1206997 RepID=A0ABV1K9D2_9PSEU
MPDPDRAGLRAAERRLQAAQLASDVPALDALLVDDALFAGPDGVLLGKEDDLGAHRGGHQVLHRIDEHDLQVRIVGTTGVTTLLATLEGAIGGEPFTARVRYTRTWTHDEQHGWRVVAAQATIAADGPPA